MQKIRANIHLRNIRANAQAFKTLTGTRLCAVVKANAYGHGAEETVCALEGIADVFAVSLLCEAVAIRTAACGKDILILTPPVSEEDVYLALANGFILTVPDLVTARLVAKTSGKYRLKARVHLKVNTGMNRYGMNGSMLGKVCKFLRGNERVSTEGLYSHLYGGTRASAEKQRALFLEMERVCRRYFPDILCHLSATFGATLGKEFAFDMVRIGIGLYGYLPDSATVDGEVVKKLGLRKAMTVYAVTTVNRRYSFGGAGYGTPRGKIEKGERLSVCRIGYADGILRKRENGVCEWERNANNACMDACVRTENKRRGAWVKILDDAAETARLTGTISYEVLCAATRRAEMTYDDE